MTDLYVIGIDVSKDTLDVFIHPEGKSQRYANTKAGRHTPRPAGGDERAACCAGGL
jgi:transposase